MKILQVINSLNPQNGGTVAAAALQAQEFSQRGHQVDFVTVDQKDASYLSAYSGQVYALGSFKNKYGFSYQLIKWLKKYGSTYDAVVIHGLWQFPSLATRLAARQAHFKYFIFTHAMLDPWFKRTYPLKHLKKIFYWALAEYWVLKEAKAVLFTSEEEKILARDSFSLYKANEIVVGIGIPYPTDNPEESKKIFFHQFPELKNKHLLLFLSRIHPKKGCDLLIKALGNVKEIDPNLHLIMAGPDNENWSPELKQLAKAVGVENSITWTGMLHGDQKWAAYRAADVFVLPSHSENFGVVVAEALACELPVLTTNKVNIWREISHNRAGFIEDDTLTGVTGLLQQWAVLSKAKKDQMRINAKLCFEQHFEISKTIDDLLAVLQN